MTLTPLVLTLSARNCQTRLQLAPRPVRCLHLAHANPDPPPNPRGRAAHKTQREGREDGHACMSADNRVLRDSHARTRQTGGELLGVDNVESCHTNDFAVVETRLLVVLTHGRNHGVHKVHNHSHHRDGTELFTSFEESPGDARVDLKEVITSHTGFCGTPAGMSTRWHPVKHHPADPPQAVMDQLNPNTLLGYSKVRQSASTPSQRSHRHSCAA